MDKTPPRYPVTCEIDGKTYRGTYWVAGKILTVSTGPGTGEEGQGVAPLQFRRQRSSQDRQCGTGIR